MPKDATTDREIENCFPVLAQLRTHLLKETFLPLIRHMETEGYRLAYIEEDGGVVAVAGYRIATNLFLGKHLYVDDLVTAEDARSKGHGEAMMRWLGSRAVENGCRVLHLDSSTKRHRAHAFYFRQGMVISSFHFSQDL